MKSPFQYGKLAEGKTFVNRVQEKHELKSNLYSGINTMLISPRRWGKSSLVREAMGELINEQSNIKICYLDTFAVRSSHEFYSMFTREVIKATSSSLESWIRSTTEYLKSLSPKISIGADPLTDFSISFDVKNIEENEIEILNLPQRIAANKGIKIIICIDEFQNLSTLSDYDTLEAKMRTVWQHQTDVSYCLYGSKRHMMIDIFNSSSKPFYRFGQIMFLNKIATGEWVKYIVDRFSSTGKKISEELAEKIVLLVNNHSWYVQQLAHFVWLSTEKEVTENNINNGIKDIINNNLPLYISECENLSVTQLNMLVAICKGEKQLSSIKTMQEYSLGTPQNITKNKTILQSKDILNKTVDGLEFLDPVFEKWFILEFCRG